MVSSPLEDLVVTTDRSKREFGEGIQRKNGTSECFIYTQRGSCGKFLKKHLECANDLGGPSLI